MSGTTTTSTTLAFRDGNGNSVVSGAVDNSDSQSSSGEVSALKERLRKAKEESAVLKKLVKRYGLWAAKVVAAPDVEQAKREYERCTHIRVSRKSSFFALLRVECEKKRVAAATAAAAAIVGCADPRTQALMQRRRRHAPMASTLETSGRSFREFPAADRRTATAAPLAPYGAAADRRTPLAPYGAVADRRTALAPFSAATGMPPAYTPSPLTPTPSPEETYASYYPIPSQAYAYQMPVGGQQYADSRRFIGSGPQAFNPSSTPSPAYISSSVASEPVLYRPSIPTYTGINWRRTKRSRQELEEGTVDCTATAHKRRHLEHSRGVVESSVEVDEAIKT